MIHPDLEEALAAAEDALSAALGREVKVRARGEGCRVELDFDSPAEAVQLAEQLLSRGLRRAAEAPSTGAIITGPGRLAQSVRARL